MRNWVACVLIALASVSCTQVDTGEIGIKTRFGEITEGPIDPGLHFYNVFTSKIFTLDVREQKIQQVAQCFTRDTQNAGITYALNYFPEKNAIVELYRTLGHDWTSKIIIPVVESALKDTTGQFIADELIGKREAVTQLAAMKVREALKARGVNVKDLNLVNIDFSDAYEAAVEAKSVARQRAEEAKNKTVEIQEEGRQKVIGAEAEARSMKIRADALTQNRSLTEWEAVQKWDGKLPQYMTGGATVPFLNLNPPGK